MNAIITLCHFCEVHGPGPIFSTQTLRDSKIDEIPIVDDPIAKSKSCLSCSSIGPLIGMLSRDNESNANFLSTQITVIPDAVPLVKQAAYRSLSCETSSSEDGGFVFFGDSTRGHVLSHTFQIRDVRARGFFRLFSIVVLMKDKTFLLNIQPFLADQLEKISKELRNYAFATYTAEQSKQSVRAQRLEAGQASVQPSRSLADLTDEVNIYGQLHSHFAWILWAGARCLTETVTLGSPSVPPWISSRDTEEGFSVVQMDKEEWLIRRYNGNGALEFGASHLEDGIEETYYSLRKCKDILQSDFVGACYCTIVGIQIIFRGPQHQTTALMKALRKLIPEPMHKLSQLNYNHYVPTTECRMLCLSGDTDVPQPCNGIFRIDFLKTNLNSEYGAIIPIVDVKWLGELPTKLPDLLIKINKAVNEKLFNDVVLEKHIKVLVEEWKNKVFCMKKITSNSELGRIKKILGVQQQDQQHVNYWLNSL